MNRIDQIEHRNPSLTSGDTLARLAERLGN